MKKILIIHGPNLNMLGARPLSIYGSKTLDEVNDILIKKCSDYNISAEISQYNSEGDIINRLHESYKEFYAIIINAGAYTHYSIAIRDAIECLNIPCIEVHLSNIYSREEFRKTSVISPVCTGSISGFGHLSYIMAIDYIANYIQVF